MNYFYERNEVVENYARALFEVANESNSDLFEIIRDLEHFEVALQSQEIGNLKKLLYHPFVSVDEKIKTVHNIYDGNAEQIVVEFIVALTEEQRLSSLTMILQEFKGFVRDVNNIIKVQATFGIEPTEDEIENIKNTLKKKLNVSSIDFEYEVDNSLIGGVKLFYNGKYIDNTLSTKINRYARQIKS